ACRRVDVCGNRLAPPTHVHTFTRLHEQPHSSSRPSTSARSSQKSNTAGSAKCEGTTLHKLEKIVSVRPGYLRSHSRSMFLISTRCMFSCEPHREHGMSGNSRARA